MKILLDTDIGSDIDDAIALAYLLLQPACDIVGITTVSGGSLKRAQLASALCMAAGKDIPICPGAQKPLCLPKQQQTAVPQAQALIRWPHASRFPAPDPVRFMHRLIHQSPNEVVLLAIGPLTNVARLFKNHPDVPELLSGLVIMGGMIHPTQGWNPRTREWNVKLDPHASDIVYRTDVKLHRSVVNDVTVQVTQTQAQVRKWLQSVLNSNVHALLLDLVEIWFAKKKHVVFHDPLTATTLFDEKICQFQRGTLVVELVDARSRGRTFWKADYRGRHEVALSVEPEVFFQHLRSVL